MPVSGGERGSHTPHTRLRDGPWEASEVTWSPTCLILPCTSSSMPKATGDVACWGLYGGRGPILLFQTMGGGSSPQLPRSFVPVSLVETIPMVLGCSLPPPFCPMGKMKIGGVTFSPGQPHIYSYWTKGFTVTYFGCPFKQPSTSSAQRLQACHSQHRPPRTPGRLPWPSTAWHLSFQLEWF